jgi:uncharacterized protein (DUF58 family)
MSVETADLDSLSDAQLWQIAERYSLRLRRLADLSLTGRKHPRHSRLGSDFSGYLPYRPGDDVRHVDWSVFARARTLQVRCYDDESSGRLVILLDGSGSMNVGTPNKWTWARAIGTIIAFAALRQSHQVIIGVTAARNVHWLPPQHGVAAAAEIGKFLRAHTPHGEAQLGAAVTGLDSSLRRGRLLVISDFLTAPHGGADLRQLDLLGLRALLVRVTAPQEFELSGEGAADPEGTGRIVYDPVMQASFSQVLSEFVAEIEEGAHAMDAPLITVTTDDDFAIHLASIMRELSSTLTGPNGRAS